jgi:hypothetical protein
VGTNFVASHTNAVNTLPNTTAVWNGSSRATQYGSGTQLTFNLSSADANTEGIFSVAALGPGTFATPSFTVPGEARHYISSKSADNVGNAETQK